MAQFAAKMATRGIPAAPVPSSTSTNCKLCGGYYRDPRLLHCLHTFCKSCLDSVVKENEEKTTCPTCHKVSPHPPHRLSRHVRLENEAAISRRLAKIQSEQSCGSCDSKEQVEAYCHQCDASLCSLCIKSHKSMRGLRDHKVEALTNISTSLTSSLVYCTDHPGKVLEYYCTTCSSLICHECYMFEHKEHKYCRIQEAMKVENADITNSLPSLKKAHSTVSQSKEKVESVMLSITNRREAIKSHINDIFQSIIAALEKRHQELLKEVDVFALTKSSPLQTQLDSLNELVSDIECVMSTCSEASEEFSPTEFLAIKCTLSEVMSSLMKQVEGTKLEAVSNDNIYCTLDPKPVLSAITKLSSVSSCSSEAFDCSLVDINPKQPIGIPNSGKCSLVLEIYDKTGKKTTVEEHIIHSKLTDKSSSNVSEVSVRYNEEGRYELIIAPPTSEGSYLLHVQLYNDNIKDSPYSINVRDYSKIKEPLLTLATKPIPAYLYVDDEGNIYVTFDDGSIVVYNDKGEIARTIPADKLNVKNARGIAVDKANNIMYIASAGTNKIVKATLDGKFITSMGESGSGELQFNWPIGLHFGKDELLYVADGANKRVQVLRSDLSFVRPIMKCQSNIFSVSPDSTGNIHVGTYGGIIEIFSSVRDYIGQYGSGIVQHVGDIAFMRNGDCVVTNYIPNTRGNGILVFRGNDKTLLHLFGNNNQNPLGVFIDQAGYIYVAEHYGSRVLKY